MVEHEWVTIPGQVPAKSNCYKVITTGGHGGLAKQEALKRYEKAFYWQLPASYRNLLIRGPFEIHLRVYFSSTRNDLDNSLKCILDCLQYTKTINNDNQCARIVADKFVDRTSPRIEFRLVEV